MKTFSIVSILLFSIATILGMKDYAVGVKTGLFKNLYKKEVTKSGHFFDKVNVNPHSISDLDPEDFSRKRIDGHVTESAEGNQLLEEKQIKNSAENVPPPPPPPPPPPSRRSKFSNLKVSSFSRGAIERIPLPVEHEIVTPKVLPESVDTVKLPVDSLKIKTEQ